MNRSCPQCGTPTVPVAQPCPYCGLLRDAQGTQSLPARTSRRAPGAPGAPIQMMPGLILPKGTTLEKERYLLLEPRRIQQWSPTIAETLWHAHEREPETGAERSVLIADVALPTYHLHQEVSRAARRAFLGDQAPPLLNTFLEHNHTFFVFSEIQGESLQQRINRQALLREEEAMRALHELARTVVRLAALQPPITHGWISPAHLIQQGSRWQVLPASVLSAGGAAHFLEGIQAPEGIRAAFDPGSDVFAAVRTVYAGLIGIFPPPQYGLPPVKPQVSAPFAELLARGLHAPLMPDDLMTPLSWMLEAVIRAASRRSASHFSGSLAPSSHVTEIPGRSEGASVERDPFPSRVPHVASEVASVAQDVPPGSRQPHAPGAEQGMPAYPQASDGLRAVCWGGAILAVETLFLLFSH